MSPREASFWRRPRGPAAGQLRPRCPRSRRAGSGPSPAPLGHAHHQALRLDHRLQRLHRAGDAGQRAGVAADSPLGRHPVLAAGQRAGHGAAHLDGDHARQRVDHPPLRQVARSPARCPGCRRPGRPARPPGRAPTTAAARRSRTRSCGIPRSPSGSPPIGGGVAVGSARQPSVRSASASSDQRPRRRPRPPPGRPPPRSHRARGRPARAPHRPGYRTQPCPRRVGCDRDAAISPAAPATVASRRRAWRHGQRGVAVAPADPVGLRRSSLIMSRRRPRLAAQRRSASSGVLPSPSETSRSRGTGSWAA